MQPALTTDNKSDAPTDLTSLQDYALCAIMKLPDSKQVELLSKYAEKYGVKL